MEPGTIPGTGSIPERREEIPGTRPIAGVREAVPGTGPESVRVPLPIPPMEPLPDETPPALGVAADWPAFVAAWNQSGQLAYTAFQPSGVILHGLQRLSALYGRDGPERLIRRVADAQWLRQHPKSLEWALREQNLTRIMDGELSQIFSESKPRSREKDSWRQVSDFSDVRRADDW
ncbi:MAG: hypothetical protein Q4C47_01635 [Planctomycetia bacterium]|nr:hypothetical protein [Planctomycetia bacterium]